jgi:NAD(P)-dependent dehydrogenase (short-subunit alcohol dehydrogenase family)
MMAAQMQYPGIAGKVVFNTGAASGIGLAMAQAFARQGAHLMLLDLDEAGLKRVRSELQAAHPDVRVETCVASITDPLAVEDAMQKTVEIFGRLDVLLNNAGISMNKPSLEVTPEEWRRTIDIDLSGIFFCCQSAARRMILGGGGVMLATASMWGLASSARRTAYCAAKAGVVSLCKSLAVEWAEHGIRVNAICPGYIQTALVSDLVGRGVLDEHALSKRTPLGRMGTPEEVAQTALYLASDLAAFVTGHAMVLDGGWTANGA